MKRMRIAASIVVMLFVANVAAAAGLTASQRTEANARMALAKQLVALQAIDAADGQQASSLRLALMQKLLALPSSSLRVLAGDGTILSARDLMAKARNLRAGKPGGKVLGDVDADLVFTPITPCRLADSRFDTVPGPLVGAISFGYSEEDSALLGGDPNCSIQLGAYPEASAYALNLTVLNMNTQSFIAIRPIGASEVTSIVNFTGPGQQVNNFVIVQNLNNSGNEFEVFVPSGVTLDVILDMFGIFLPPEATALQCQDTTATTFGIAASTNDVTVTSPACATGYTAVSGNCSETAPSTAQLVGYKVSGNAWACTWDNGGSASTVSVAARCCRVPGR